MVNHFENINRLTTKLGLCRAIKNIHWVEKTNAEHFFPRCYDLYSPEDLEDFIEDFKMTKV